MKNKVYRLSLVAVVVAVVFCSLSSSTLAQVRLLSSLTHKFTVAPGEIYEGSLLLENRSDTPEEALIEQCDYSFDAEGRSYYLQPGTLPRTNALWVQIGPTKVTVPPHSTLPVSFQIMVPDDAALTGTYWSMVLVEPIPPKAENTPEDQGKGVVSVQQRLRYGVQIVTTVGATGTSQLLFTNPKLFQDETGLVFQVDLANEGERWLVPQVWLDIYGETGEKARTVAGEQRRLFPGTSVRQTFRIGVLAPGNYPTLLMADNGDAAVFGARYTLQME